MKAECVGRGASEPFLQRAPRFDSAAQLGLVETVVTTRFGC